MQGGDDIARFDNFEILCRHIPIVLDRVTNLIQSANEPGILGTSFKSADGQKIWRHFKTQGGETNTTPGEISAVISGVLPKLHNIITDFDYVCNWLYLCEMQLTVYSKRKFMFDVEWGLPVTLRACKMFTTFSKAVTAIQPARQKLQFVWMSHHTVNRGQCITPKGYVDLLLKELDGPFDFIASRFEFLIHQLSGLTLIISPVLTQVLSQYSTFDWGCLSIEGSDMLDSGSSMTPLPLIVLRYVGLFRETLLFFALAFPEYFSEKVHLISLATALLSESPVIILSSKKTLELTTLLQLCKRTLPQTITDTWNKDRKSKRDTSHVMRMKNLAELFADYHERYLVGSDVLSLYIDQLLAMFGFAYSELAVCWHEHENKNLCIELLTRASIVFFDIEEASYDIMRTFMYTMCFIDSGYMDDLLNMFGNIRSSETDVVAMVQSLCSVLSTIDIEAFDNGYRYDFTPFILSQGRVCFSTLTHMTGEAYLKPIMLHLGAVCNHAQLANDPVNYIHTIIPMGELQDIYTEIPNFIRNPSTQLDLCVPAIMTYKFFAGEDGIAEITENGVKELIKKLIQPLDDSISIQSRSIRIARQSAFDAGFKPEAFMPLCASYCPKENYQIETTSTDKLAKVMQIMTTLPSEIGISEEKSIPLREMMKTALCDMVCGRILDVKCHPLMVASTLTTVCQTIRPFFTILGVPFASFILTKLRSAAPLPEGGSLKIQAQVLAGAMKNTEPSGFIKYYTSELQKFILTDHKMARYEPLGRRFVATCAKAQSIEHMFGLQPLIHIVQTFGVNAAIHIDCILMKFAFEALTLLLIIFEGYKSKLTQLHETFLRTGTLTDIWSTVSTDVLKNGGNNLLSLGLVMAIRDMLSSAVTTLTEDVMYGFNNVLDAALLRSKTLTDEDAAFIEAIMPGSCDYFLEARAKLTVRSPVDPHLFFFFLGLLMGNPDWRRLEFDLENDLFNLNLQLIPHALGKVVALQDVFFASSPKSQIQGALRSFFTTTAAIGDMKRNKRDKSYTPFIILMDHFASLTDHIVYGHMEHAFPYSQTRACYNDLAQDNKQVEELMAMRDEDENEDAEPQPEQEQEQEEQEAKDEKEES